MARDFKTLMRINDWQVDQKRRDLAREQEQLDNLIGRLEALVAEVAHEQELASAQPTEAGLTFGAYAETALRRRENLEAAIENQRKAVEDAREAVRLAYLEYKKFEIAEDRRVEQEDADLAKAEQAELDEIGITAHTRKSR